MSKAFITVASWEDRFIAGVNDALKLDVEVICCLASKRYSESTADNRRAAIQICAARGIQFETYVFDFYNAQETFELVERVSDFAMQKGARDIFFDISTGPRNIIWSVLDSLAQRYEGVSIRYIRAAKYGDWQTDNDLDPRILVNCSGIMYPDLPTCLVMMCGPEIARVEKMIYKFEPRKSIVLRDVEATKYGVLRRFDLLSSAGVSEISFDNKDLSESSIDVLDGLIRPLVGTYNIVCSSFGPKLGAIALYRIHRKYEEVALAYVPAGRHNPQLSEGAQPATEYYLRFNT